LSAQQHIQKRYFESLGKSRGFFILKMEVLLMQDTKTYTVQEVAQILRVRKGYVYDMIYTGRLRAIRLSERRFRITQQALGDFFLQEEMALESNGTITGLRLEV
jgi:excisionase family DNA binding protein